MKVGKERSSLERALVEVFEKYNLNKEIINKIKNEFVERGVGSGEFLSIIDGGIRVETIPLDMLCLISELFYQETKEKNINPETYFNESEISESKKFRRETEKQSKFPLVFEDVMKISEDHYVTYKTAQEVKKYYDRNIITYNKQTQRNVKYTEYHDKIIEMISINKNSITDIEKDIIEGRQITNFITLNILQNGEEEFKYDARTKTLTVLSGDINILDGFHRSLGMINSVQKVPNVHYITGINIVNWDVEKSRRFIVQEDKRNKINQSYVKSLNPEKYENMIVKKINESSASDLKGKIATDMVLIRSHRALTTYDVINSAIIHEYTDIKSNRDSTLIAEWLIDFFNELIGIYPDAFLSEIEATKANSYINHVNMFSGYVSLSKELQGRNDWRQKLQEALSKIDFSKDNKIWEEFKIEKDSGVRTLRAISKYFKSFV